VTDETLLSASFSSSLRPDPFGAGGDEPSLQSHLWTGMLHEFRNQLTLLLAGTTEIRAALPPSAAFDLAETLEEMESSLQSITTLTGCIDTAMRPGPQVISDLGDVIERSIAAARGSIHPGVEITVSSRVGAVRNRSGAVDSALSLLIVDLARAAEFRRGRAANEIQIEVFTGRGALTIEIVSSAAHLPPPSWRRQLAQRLAATVAGTLELLPDRVGYCLRFQ
jgi:hypothetical protein